MRVLIYQNPDAGHEPRPPRALVDEVQRAGHEVVWKNAKEDRLTDATLQGVDLVVAAGGDGNVGRTARQLVGKGIPIAVLPLGTANNLASTLDAGQHDLAERIAAWRVQPFDSGTLRWRGSDERFFEAVGIGAFAETAAMLCARDATRRSEPDRDAELTRDITELIERSRTQPPLDVEVRIDRRTIHGGVILLEAQNIGLIGPRVNLAPAADPCDGALDVVLVQEDQRQALTRFLEACAAGARPPGPFEVIRATRVRLVCGRAVTAHVDGKVVDLPADAEVEIGVEPHAVRFLGGITPLP